MVRVSEVGALLHSTIEARDASTAVGRGSWASSAASRSPPAVVVEEDSRRGPRASSDGLAAGGSCQAMRHRRLPVEAAEGGWEGVASCDDTGRWRSHRGSGSIGGAGGQSGAGVQRIWTSR